MVVGGRNRTAYQRNVEFVSLDPDNHPVPSCLEKGSGDPYPNDRTSLIRGGVVNDGRLIAKPQN